MRFAAAISFDSEKSIIEQDVLRQKRQDYRQALVQKLRAKQDVVINHVLLRRISG